MLRVTIDIAYMYTKFDDSGYNRSRDMIISTKTLSGSCDHEHVVSGVILSSVAGTCYGQPIHQV